MSRSTRSPAVTCNTGLALLMLTRRGSLVSTAACLAGQEVWRETSPSVGHVTSISGPLRLAEGCRAGGVSQMPLGQLC